VAGQKITSDGIVKICPCHNLCVMSQVVVCGILLIAMAIGNFANTVDTLMVKSRFKAKMKKSKSKRDLDSCTSPKGSSQTDSIARA
jgi:hypothetical protein